ncbi:MAG: hypothetical protein ACRDLB_16160 [Actinomycetota bacterium]
MTREAHAVVQDLLSATEEKARDSLAFELSELLYDAKTIEVLEPLYQSSDPDHARRLAAILYEHGDRSDEFVGWIDAYLDHDDGNVRYWAAGCAAELDPVRYPETIARMLAKLYDIPPVAAGVTAYLSWVDIDDLDRARAHLSGELRELIAWLQEGDYKDWERLYREDGVAALVAVAALGRELPTEPERLENVRESDDEAVALAARRISERVRPYW